ncbi:MAG: ParB N-terminal domain-containing protein [Symplocastrum torsivum CPER-KK1]|jgi:ParB family chromosome partitioning protein|uniref:ParB N-terminal domain-containing protein n=1 Tax=Symplocastrum torsivum CPER-KK1 TaxID=450513 RepID=A0A951PTE5_9CYAN|nr:ParB N-terminal domain-containing protein [Symplocastrum torsivum CPER-KK1]
MSVYSQVNPKELKPHPKNSSIYGEDEDVTELIDAIHKSGWVKALVITKDGTIISGHRRWKAALTLEWQSVPVEEREFSDEAAELEALLRENQSRDKTTEQKVREALVWKEIESYQARMRQIELAGTRPNHNPDLVENFPQGQRGRTRDRLAQLVNLGSGRTYSKAAKVVEAIDKETVFGNLQTAQRLRSTLNSKSVDAAYQLLTLTRKRANNPEDNSSHRDNLTPSIQGSEFLLSHQSDRFPNTIRSCWTCQHRDRLIENHSFHCTHLGTLSLIDKDACTRGEECDLWCDRDVEQIITTEQSETSPELIKPQTFSIEFPEYLRSKFQDAARASGMSVVDWALVVLESASGQVPEGGQN